MRKDIDTALPYARHDMVAFVLYFSLDIANANVLDVIEHRLINITLDCGGTFYLPYRLSHNIFSLRGARLKKCLHTRYTSHADMLTRRSEVVS